MWKPEEDELIEEGVRRFGLKWRKVASALPGRTDSSVRNRWQRLQKEREERRKNPPPGKPPIPGASAPPPAGLAMPPRGRAAPPAGPLGHGSPLRGFDLELFCSTVEGVLEGVDEEGPPTTDAASPGAAAFEGLRMDESNPNTQMGMTALATVHTERSAAETRDGSLALESELDEFQGAFEVRDWLAGPLGAHPTVPPVFNTGALGGVPDPPPRAALPQVCKPSGQQVASKPPGRGVQFAVPPRADAAAEDVPEVGVPTCLRLLSHMLTGLAITTLCAASVGVARGDRGAPVALTCHIQYA